MTISVVILNWNGEKHLQKFLPSVVKHSVIDGCEVVVADNGSTDNSVAFLRENYPNIRLILFDKNYGFTGGYNRAIAQIESKYSVLLNSDVEVTEGWLEPILADFEQNDNLAAAMPKIRAFSDPTKFEHAGAAGGYLDFIGLPYCRGRVLSEVETDNGQYDTKKEIFWASGAAMFIKTELYKVFGGLDDDFFAHMEEIDLCWRLKSAGYSIICNPQSVVYHLGGGTLGYTSPFKLHLNFRNSLYMLYKNLPSSQLWGVLFIRMCFDGAIAMIYLLTGKIQLFKAVFKAHISFYRALPSLKKKRKSIVRTHTAKRRGFLPLKLNLER